jgi:hypothetical protein
VEPNAHRWAVFIFEFFGKIEYHKNRKLKRTIKLAASFLVFTKNNN